MGSRSRAAPSGSTSPSCRRRSSACSTSRPRSSARSSASCWMPLQWERRRTAASHRASTASRWRSSTSRTSATRSPSRRTRGHRSDERGADRGFAGTARRTRNRGHRREGLTRSGHAADAIAILSELMASERGQQASLTPLPSVEELPALADGRFDPERVKEAFESFRRHTTQLQVQLRVLQAAARSGQVEPTGHAVRMDALHMIRAAADMADTIERDAQTASAAQFRRTEEDVSRRQRALQEREHEVERFRQESERQRAEILNAARNEAREAQAEAQRHSTAEIREAEARASRLLEQARHQATELTNSARAEVEQTLEWARAQ